MRTCISVEDALHICIGARSADVRGDDLDDVLCGLRPLGQGRGVRVAQEDLTLGPAIGLTGTHPLLAGEVVAGTRGLVGDLNLE